MSDPFPTLAVSCAFTPNPPGTYTDITGYVDGPCTISRGRQYETNTMQPATGTVTLDNSDGRFTGGRAASPYSPHVLPARAVTVVATPPGGGASYPLFTGISKAWPTTWPGGGAYAESALSLVDAAARLSRRKLQSPYRETILANGPSGYWTLDDAAGSTAAVSTMPGGAANPASITGPVSNFVFGGASLLAADTGSSCTVGGNPNGWLNLPPGNPGIVEAFVAEVVFSATSMPAGGGYLLEGYERAPSDTLGLGADLVQLMVTQAGAITLNAAEGSLLSTAGGYLDGKPHHVVAVVRGVFENALIYVDGVLAASGSGMLAPDPVVLVAAGRRFTGALAHLAYYPGNYVSTAAQVAADYQATLGYPGDTADARIGRILGWCGWPAGARALDAGFTPLVAMADSSTDALTAIGQAALSDNGYAFVAANGNFTFHNRRRRLDAAPVAVLDVSKQQIDPDLSFAVDDLQLANVLNITINSKTGGSRIRKVASSSATDFGEYTRDITVDVADPAALSDWAGWLLYQTATPLPRAGTVTIDPLSDASLWPVALGAEVGQRITLTNLPADAPAPTIDFYIEKVEHSFSRYPGEWKTRLQLSPAPAWQCLRADAAPSAYTALDAGLVIPY